MIGTSSTKHLRRKDSCGRFVHLPRVEEGASDVDPHVAGIGTLSEEIEDGFCIEYLPIERDQPVHVPSDRCDMVEPCKEGRR